MTDQNQTIPVPTPFGLEVKPIQLDSTPGQMIVLHTVLGPVHLFCDNEGAKDMANTILNSVGQSESKVIRPVSSLILPGQS